MYRVLLPVVLAAMPSVVAAQPLAGQAASGQTYPGRDTDDARSNAIAARTAPGVAAANDRVMGQVGPTGTVPAGAQAAYADDVRAYDAARRARRHAINRDQAYYDRQQRAYAMAMADWRAQTAACHRGNNRACRAQGPRPGDYM